MRLEVKPKKKDSKKEYYLHTDSILRIIVFGYRLLFGLVSHV